MNCNRLSDANHATITRPSPLSTQSTRIAKLYFTTIWNWEPGSIMALMLKKKNVGQLSAQWVCHILKYTSMFSESTVSVGTYSLCWPDVDLLGLLNNIRTPLLILNGDTICPSLCPFPLFFFLFISTAKFRIPCQAEVDCMVTMSPPGNNILVLFGCARQNSSISDFVARGMTKSAEMLL